MFLSIGQIVNTHGISGEVRVRVYSDHIERFEGMERIYVAAAGAKADAPERRLLTITGLRYHKDMVLMRFGEISDMTQALQLKGAFLQTPEEELPLLPEGRYYIYQLEGLAVWENESCYGRLTEVLQPGGNDVYVVTDGEREILIPALKTVIKSVDVKQGRMEVELPAGLLDIYTQKGKGSGS